MSTTLTRRICVKPTLDISYPARLAIEHLSGLFEGEARCAFEKLSAEEKWTAIKTKLKLHASILPEATVVFAQPQYPTITFGDEEDRKKMFTADFAMRLSTWYILKDRSTSATLQTTLGRRVSEDAS